MICVLFKRKLFGLALIPFMLSGCSDDVAIPSRLSCIPRIEIFTDGQQEIVSNSTNIKSTIEVSNVVGYPDVRLRALIRGRGNATWQDYPKKPHKMKLDTEYNLLGFPADKDWILLSEYTDKSLLRTSYMCELAKFAGVECVLGCQHVELRINGEDIGTYLF